MSGTAKMTKDVFNKKVLIISILAAGIATPALQFLQAEKRKQVHVTSLTLLRLLPSPCNFLQVEK